MLMYGSILIEVTLRPPALSIVPMLLAMMPFPTPLITPPVTKIYFIVLHFKTHKPQNTSISDYAIRYHNGCMQSCSVPTAYRATYSTHCVGIQPLPRAANHVPHPAVNPKPICLPPTLSYIESKTCQKLRGQHPLRTKIWPTENVDCGWVEIAIIWHLSVELVKWIEGFLTCRHHQVRINLAIY